MMEKANLDISGSLEVHSVLQDEWNEHSCLIVLILTPHMLLLTAAGVSSLPTSESKKRASPPGFGYTASFGTLAHIHLHPQSTRQQLARSLWKEALNIQRHLQATCWTGGRRPNTSLNLRKCGVTALRSLVQVLVLPR